MGTRDKAGRLVKREKGVRILYWRASALFRARERKAKTRAQEREKNERKQMERPYWEI